MIILGTILIYAAAYLFIGACLTFGVCHTLAATYVVLWILSRCAELDAQRCGLRPQQ